MSRNLPLPFLPVPPKEYQQGYFAEVVRSISIYMENERNPGEGRNTSLVLTNLQSNDQGLETGALFESEGFVNITKAYAPHVAGVWDPGVVGTVTVSTV